MKLFSYILVHDIGAMPNPFFDICTLAICKPRIRSSARVGDWIMATGSARNHTHTKLVYAMRITEILPLDQYFTDPRFQNKKPLPNSPDPHRRAGDNLYSKNKFGSWTQLPGPRDPAQTAKDTSGKNALISTHFFYFGSEAIPLPPSLQKLIHLNQGHRSQFPEDLIQRFTHWLESKHTPGLHGQPTDSPPPVPVT